MSQYLAEIFSSAQGEGLFLGCRQIFLRFPGCNLSCAYCDTKLPDRPEYCRVELVPGNGEFTLIPNPLSIDQIVGYVNSFQPSRHHSVSITGGEPLLYADFLKELIPLLPVTRKGVFLETNGSLPEQLEKVIDLVDIIAMDIKIPSATGLLPLWDEHAEFLKIAAGKETFVKVVITGTTVVDEIAVVVSLLERAGDLPLILQPVTPVNGILPVSPGHALRLQSFALTRLSDVRIIPQTHRIAGLL